MNAAVILSGGAEIGALAVAESLHRGRIPYYVLSLKRRSLIEGAPGSRGYAELAEFVGSPDLLAERLVDRLADWSSSGRLVVFATEDGGLRTLNECAPHILSFADFPRARMLRMGGLDKAEFYEFLHACGAHAVLPRTEVIESEAEAERALERFGADAVFKPALKPWDMDLSAMGAKIVTRGAGDRSADDVLERLRRAWSLSRRWIVQERLQAYPQGERGVWLVRGRAVTRVMQVDERWKYPERGGTACWVRTTTDRDLERPVLEVVDRLDHVGLAEAAFLCAPGGGGRLLELNPRAWLQVGLAEAVGLDAVAGSFRALTGQADNDSPSPTADGSWVNVERCLLAIASKSAESRLAKLAKFFGALAAGPLLAVYSTRFPRTRWRWIAGLFARVIRPGVGV
ncbi:MAG TPA: hypothetical protein VFE72_02225 [Lysobacter sp.]|nr:hypothetical protein [Lysobacter sp.]